MCGFGHGVLLYKTCSTKRSDSTIIVGRASTRRSAEGEGGGKGRIFSLIFVEFLFRVSCVSHVCRMKAAITIGALANDTIILSKQPPLLLSSLEAASCRASVSRRPNLRLSFACVSNNFSLSPSLAIPPSTIISRSASSCPLSLSYILRTFECVSPYYPSSLPSCLHPPAT